MFERLEEQIATLKEENKSLSSRLAKLNSVTDKNRANSKTLLQERDNEIISLKHQYSSTHKSMTAQYDKLLDEYNNFKEYHTTTLEAMKKDLDEKQIFTDYLKDKSTNLEDRLYTKNAQLLSHIDTMKELDEKQKHKLYELDKQVSEKDEELARRNDTICNLYSKLLSTENTNREMKIKVDYLTDMINALRKASSYISDVLSHSI